MGLLEEYGWALEQAVAELQDRGRLSGTLPVGFTMPALQYLRARACRVETPKIDCERWSLKAKAISNPNPCEGCRHPKRVFQERVLETLFHESLDRKTWARMAHQSHRVKYDDFRIAITNAFVKGWLTLAGFESLLNRTRQLEIAKLALGAEVQRVKDRGNRMRHDREEDRVALERELERQANLLDQKERIRARRVFLRVQGALSPDLRNLLQSYL